MNIGIDVDGVLTDAESYQIRTGIAHFLPRGKEIANPLAYDVRDMFNVNKRARAWFWIRHIWRYCWSEPARENAAVTIQRLRADGHKIYIITARVFSRARGPIGMLFRYMLVRWLKNHGIEYDAIYFCAEKNGAGDKLLACRALEIDVMLEDRADNIDALRPVVARIFCFDAGHNRQCGGENVVRVYGFDGIYSLVVGDCNGERTA